MELLTSELREMLPPLYSQEYEEDPLVMCKFFTPDAGLLPALRACGSEGAVWLFH